MEHIIGLRPFVPAKDYDISIAFYEALGFTAAYRDSEVTILKLGEFGFILQNFYVEEFAKNSMVQLLVSNLDAVWAEFAPARLTAQFPVKEPIPPAMQHWGLRVGFIFDPAGVLWHVAEQPPGLRA